MRKTSSGVFAACFGAFFGLSLLKFGNPPIMEKWVTAPTNFWEFLLDYPWPISWAYWMLAFLSLFGLVIAFRLPWLDTGPVLPSSTAEGGNPTPRHIPRWFFALPLLWLVWQCFCTIYSVDADLSKGTLKHFAACVACFYLGFIPLRRIRWGWPFWTGLLLGLVLVLVAGFEQHFGGLEETRRYFLLYLYPTLKEVPPGYLKKLSSNRIFATLFYPNALAGCLLLLLPPLLVVISRLLRVIWRARDAMTDAARWVLAGLVGLAGICFFAAAMSCLYWSGSKGGWLLMLLLGLIALLRLQLPKYLKISILCLVLAGGLAGFVWKYSSFFQKGATSVAARFDYWRAALHICLRHPALGTGPGTFAIAYEQIKRQESEMTRLVHNDYLEQASDSGIIGFLTYTAFVLGTLVLCFPGSTLGSPASERCQVFAVWLGLLGWGCQSLMEFGLYIPALAWPGFAFLGAILGTPFSVGSEKNRMRAAESHR